VRQFSQWKLSSLKPVLAGLMATLFLAVTILGASDRLHATLHAGEEGHGHSPCAVCAIVKGQVDTPTVAVSEVFAALSATWTLPSVQIIAPAVIDLMVAPSRGPPVSVSSQS